MCRSFPNEEEDSKKKGKMLHSQGVWRQVSKLNTIRPKTTQKKYST